MDTVPNVVNDNAELYCKSGLPFVLGTTGGDMDLLCKIVEDSKLYAMISPQTGKQIVDHKWQTKVGQETPMVGIPEDRTWYQSRWLDQWEDRSWLNRRLEGIRLKKLRNISNKLETMELQEDQRNKDEVFAKKMKKSRCYVFLLELPHEEKSKKQRKTVMEDNQTEKKEEYKQVYKEHVKITGDYTVIGTELGTWNEIWYVNTSISKHMSPFKDLIVRLKKSFTIDTKEHKRNFIFTHGIGEIELKSNGKDYVIPYVSYVPKINMNVLSMQQLLHQGFEVEIEVSICNVRYMFDEKEDEMDELEAIKKQDKFLNNYFENLEDNTPKKQVSSEMCTDTHETEDCIEVDGKKVSLKVDTFEEFVKFMNMVNLDRIAMKNRDVFKKNFEKMLIWFHDNHTGEDMRRRIQPLLSGIEVYLFDLYKLIMCLGGYDRVSIKEKWKDVAMGFGFSKYYEQEFKELFEVYLLHPETYYEFAKDGMTWPIKYTNDRVQDVSVAANNDEDQAKGFIDQVKAAAGVTDGAMNTNKHTINTKNMEDEDSDEDPSIKKYYCSNEDESGNKNKQKMK